MLSAPDLDLARRDPAIPGLGLLLDAEAFVTALREHLPQAVSIAGAKIDYIRYKSGTNCLVAYRLDVDGTALEAHAVAYHPDLRHKLLKARRRMRTAGHSGTSGGFVLDDYAIAVYVFPNDRVLKALPRLGDPARRRKLLRNLLPDRPELWDATMRSLRYKPGRRYVAQLRAPEDAQAALKLYSKRDYAIAHANARALEPCQGVRTARLIGHLERRCILAFEWLPGRLLNEIIVDSDAACEHLARVGAAIARLHAQEPTGLVCSQRSQEARGLMAVADGIAEVCPGLGGQVDDLARRLAARLTAAPAGTVPIHGDFYAKQVLISGTDVGMLDFDRAALGDPAADLGNFLAHLERDFLHGRISRRRVGQSKAALLRGYARAAQRPLPARIDLYTAIGLLRLAPEPFRYHEADWPPRIETILARVRTILEACPTERLRAPVSGHDLSNTTPGSDSNVLVDDPFAAIGDPRMPFLPAALAPQHVRRQFQDHLPRLAGHDGRTRLSELRVVRHKPGRRCLIEYDLVTTRPGAPAETLTVIGKARARGLDEAAFQRQVSLWNNGFSDNAADGISVPEPVGMIPPFQMWLQRKLPGAVATGLLVEPGGIALAERIAHAIYKLHRANVAPRRRHGMADELRILRERLSATARIQPCWQPRIDQLLNACERLASRMPRSAPCGIHRDFYPDQVLVRGQRLYLLDLDLYCEGDPALDIGNFLGHMTEYAVRELGHPEALSAREAALEERYLALADGAIDRASVQGYKTLTLARHIHISTRFDQRRAFTQALLELCERRLDGNAPRASGSKRRAWPYGTQAHPLD